MMKVRVHFVLASFGGEPCVQSGCRRAIRRRRMARPNSSSTAVGSAMDFEGQGSVTTSGGRVIANTPLPLEAFKAYVRNPSGAMPPFHAEILSDSDLADIYAYLESRPKPQPVKDIPLLNGLSSK